MQEEVEIARKQARSFPGLIPPNSAALIGKEEKERDTINYYKDSAGNYYYDTENGRKFELDMQERRKKREDEKRKSRRRGRIT